jgi:microcystin degradation protein MlrC
LTLTIGGELRKASEKATVTGKVIHTGDILGYTGKNAGASATLDCGDITIVITSNRSAFTSLETFQSIELDISRFKIVVVKLGYLFPGLADIAKRSILAFTPGSSTERIQDMGLKHIKRPVFPLDDNFM